ncbi:MAG: mandelate racemase/muconate lactonizing enzyme family protein [Anaerolineae bacterium]
MRIVKLETYARESFGLLRLVTEEGHEGWGQLSPFNADISAMVLHRQVAPLVLGADINEQESLSEKVITHTYKFPGTYICRALVGVDTALWDLRGKLAGKSVCQLLGGTKKAVRPYGSSMRRDITAKEESERLVRLRDELGYRAFKLHTGHNTPIGRTPQLTPLDEMVPAVRKAVGSDIDILVDVNGCYTAEQAIAQMPIFIDNDVCLFEEPCPNWELEWTAQVAAAYDIPVSGGEQDYDLQQWKRIIAMQCVDLAQPDVCYIGGLTRALQVVEMTRRAGLPVVPHSANHSLVTVFTLHLMGAIPNAGPWFEFSIENNSFAWEMYSPRLQVVDGMVPIPEGPGWGVQIHQDWLEKSTRQVSEIA